MILYPAIDLKDGTCVRLLRGDMEAATVFGTDPAAQARAFQDAGAEWLHLVDLNGAFAGRPVNAAAVEGILAAVTIPVQPGGGIRWSHRVQRRGQQRHAQQGTAARIRVGVEARLHPCRCQEGHQPLGLGGRGMEMGDVDRHCGGAPDSGRLLDSHL